MRSVTVTAVAALLGLAACASIPEEEKALLAAEIDCAEAPATLAALRAARPGAGRTLRALGTSFTPAGFAVGVATNDMADRGEITSGRYAAAIDARIDLVRATCNIVDPATGRVPDLADVEIPG